MGSKPLELIYSYTWSPPGSGPETAKSADVKISVSATYTQPPCPGCGSHDYHFTSRESYTGREGGRLTYDSVFLTSCCGLEIALKTIQELEHVEDKLSWSARGPLHINDRVPNIRVFGALHLLLCRNCFSAPPGKSSWVRACKNCGWSEMEALDFTQDQQRIFELRLARVRQDRGLPNG